MQTKQEWEIGDCIDIMQTYPDNYFDLILTDPPYGLNYSNLGRLGNDNCGLAMVFTKSDWDLERLDKIYFDEMFRISKEQIVFGGNYYTDILKPTSCWIIWDKDRTGNYGDCEMAWTSFKTAMRIYKYRWNGMLQGDMKNKEERVHPTQKPVPLFTWILKNYAKEGDRIFDPFCGSGTILESCMNLNLECLAIDKSNEWVDHYIKRLGLNNTKLDAYV